MFSHRKVALCERIKEMCGLVGGTVSLGVGLEVSKAHAQPGGCLSPVADWNVALSFCSWAIPADMFPTLMITDQNSSKHTPQLNAFRRVALGVVSLPSNRTVTLTKGRGWGQVTLSDLEN